MTSPVLPNEAERLAALKRYYLLDTPPEAALDRITALATRLFSVPISLVTLIDETRQWFKAAYGLDLTETPRDIAFCAHAIASDEVMVVPNALEDARFRENPLVQGCPDIRFYAGAPLTTADGLKLGTLCIIDKVPRDPLPAEQQHLLRSLAETVMDELELRLATIAASRQREGRDDPARELADVSGRLHLSEEIVKNVLEALPVGVWIADKEGNLLHGNPAGRAIWGGSEYVGIENYGRFEGWWPETGKRIPAEGWAMARAIRHGEKSLGEVIEIRTFDGKRKTISHSAAPLRNTSGEIVGGVVVNEDITERRRSEDTLHKLKDELKGLIDASPLAIISIDRERLVTSWSAAAEQMFGWTAA